jgi:hypothetical protein
MQREHCKEGASLHLVYKRKTLEMLSVETSGRHALSLATEREFLEISRQIESARADYEDARRKYVDHEIGCDVCLKDIPTFYFVGAQKLLRCKAKGSIVRS